MPTKPDALKISTTVIAGVALVAFAIIVLRDYLPALLWASVLAVATWPTYRKFKLARANNGWQRIAAPLIATTTVALVIAIPVAIAALVVAREAHSLILWVGTVQHDGVQVPSAIGRVPFFGSYVARLWQHNLAQPGAASDLLGRIGAVQLLGLTGSFGIEILRRLAQFVLTLLTLFFLFRDGDTLSYRVMCLGRRMFGIRSTNILKHIVDAIHGTIDGLVLVGLAEGVVIGVGYWVCGVPHALMFAIITGIVAIIPMGAPIAFLSATLVLFVEDRNVAAVSLLVYSFLVLFITDHIVRPILIGGAARVPFLLIVIGILGGLASLGLIGLFVGPALMAVVMTLWRDYTDFEQDEAEGSQLLPPSAERTRVAGE
ncbi:MAG TPA: AI-2E family transporter [Rhizomicrobium sp.]|nr:AI-2E family transporter [Rhizomicrobium sp.]